MWGRSGVAAMVEQRAPWPAPDRRARRGRSRSGRRRPRSAARAACPRRSCICSCPTAHCSRCAHAGTSAASGRRRATAGDWRSRAGRCRGARSTVLTVRSRPSETTVSAWPSRRNSVDEARQTPDRSRWRAMNSSISRWRGAHQVDLAHHALARADAAGLPVLLDLAPGRRGEALEKQIGRIDRSDRSVEIDEHAALHTRSRHVNRTR